MYLEAEIFQRQSTTTKMGRHREWRKIAKKERRRKIRTQSAHKSDVASNLNPHEYGQWIKECEALELLQLEQIEELNNVENEKWLSAERIALEKWQKFEEKRKKILEERLEKEARRQLEWELEKERRLKEEERLKQIEEQNREKQEKFMNSLEQYLAGDSEEPPAELLVSRETKPGKEICPFFSKTACCRFGDQCSRNHRYPGISKVLLASNFYTHFGLENSTFSEYDTDVMLEYEDNDTYKEFKDFFYDVLPEFEKFGRVIQFKACNNYEKHLRGNVYVEFAERRRAVAAYRALHSRWYAGKQLSLQFCHIGSWKNAVCGLQSRKRCPKGRACNFLHVFRNPDNLYNSYNESSRNEHMQNNNSRSRRTPPRHWRWSESPETELPRRRRSRSRSRSPPREKKRIRRDKSNHDENKSSSRRRHSERSHRRSSDHSNRDRSR